MKIACWNAEWHRASSWQGAEIRDRLLEAQPEIICCPEAHDDFLADGWHGIFSQPNTGYPIKPGRRKVTLWSRQPWAEIDDLGSADLPPGRFVGATTTTTLGPVEVIGICIPWAASHVSSGRRDRRRWEDHILYLRALQVLLLRDASRVPTILVGDFNQCIPRRTAPIRAYEDLEVALSGYEIWTSGTIPLLDGFPVCHIGGSSQFAVEHVTGFSRQLNGRPVSDHDGLAVDVDLR